MEEKNKKDCKSKNGKKKIQEETVNRKKAKPSFYWQH
jgi:hypothetical protein